LPNARAPEVFGRHLATVHVPRRFYVQVLPGIPTIRVFEALACGIPLVSAPWSDAEGLFRPGEDYLVARDGAEMTRHLAALKANPDLRTALVRSGLETIRARHTCARRAEELLAIAARLATPSLETA
jgi:spore maturation protein CgeB